MNFCKNIFFLIVIVFLSQWIGLPSSNADSFSNDIFARKAADYYHQHKLEMSIRLYLQILENDPNNLDALINVGAALIEKGLFLEAYPYMKRLVIKFPDRPEGWINLAICEIGFGRLKDALKHLNVAEKKFDGPEFDIYLNKGIIFSKLRNFAKALEFYKKAELIKPDNPTLIFDMALLYEKKGDYKDALLYYQRYIRSSKTHLPSDERAYIEEKIYLLNKLVR